MFYHNVYMYTMYSVLNALSEYTYFYISKNITSYTYCLFLKLTKAFSVSLSHFNLTWSFFANRWNSTTFSQTGSVSNVFCFTMHNRFILIFLSLWYWFSTVIIQPRFIAQSIKLWEWCLWEGVGGGLVCTIMTHCVGKLISDPALNETFS